MNSTENQYWDGSENKAIRFYFYAQRGLALLNEARYLIMGVFALYYALRLDNPLWMIVMFFVAVPILILLGWLSVHRMGKVIDFLNIRFSTHYARKQYDLFESMTKSLENIEQKIK